MEDTIKYPRFIQNKPCGIDKFEGGSQKRLVSAISKHINDIDSLNDREYLSRIIGLEGGWGVGKSNVIKLLRTKLSNDHYYIFEYDAWGHQEDLQRRSLLELLTEKLINDSILIGNTTVRVKGGGTKEVTWDEKLKLLLARKSETITEKYPRISNSMAASVLVAILTPIFVSISFAIKPISPTWWSILLSVFISLLPILAAFAIWFKVRNKDNKYKNLDYLLAIYNDKIEKDICYETISEEEPTVVEFKAWMQDISNFLSTQSKKLIIVFDNMDRLPADKVKELWSSIHTFFAEVDSGFENVWVIIPYDEKHLACAFGDDNNENTKELTRHFVSKTFPVVYRVAPPVITDLKTIFDNLFGEAFGNTENINRETVNRIFRIEKPNATIREVIVFINQLVALKSIWEEEISIQYMAIFSLQKDKILEDPINQILSGGYLTDKTKRFFTNKDVLQKSISALVYEVSIEHAEQIPLNRYISNCLNKEDGYDINTYSIHKHFVSILEDVIKDADSVQTDTFIYVMSGLETLEMEDAHKGIISQLWKFLARQRMKMPVSKLEFEEVYKNLLLNVDDEEIKANLVKKLCRGFQNFSDFKGNDYFIAISDLDDFLQENEMQISLELTEVEKDPETFIQYISEAKEDYGKYKIKVKSTELDNYYTKLIQDDKLAYVDILETLQGDEDYVFPNLYTAIEDSIKNNKVTDENIGSIYSVYKFLTIEKPFATQLNSGQAQNLLNLLTQQVNNGIYPNGFYDIVAINISNGINIPVTLDEEQIEQVANCIEYYKTYGDLLVECVNWDIPALNKTLGYLTKQQGGVSLLNITKTLPLFDFIKNKIQVNDGEFLERLNEWSSYASKEIDKGNIQTIIPNAIFFQYSKNIKNELTNHLHKTVVESLSEINEDTLYQQRSNINNNQYYWFIVVQNLIDSEFLEPIPENILGLGKKILEDIAKGEFAIPAANDLLKTILDRLDKGKIVPTIRDIRDYYCSGTYNITTQLFMFFENWFEGQGDLKGSQAGRVAHKVIRPIINDANCLNRILSKASFYAEVIHNAGDDANDLKEDIRRKIQTSLDIELIAFAGSIGIEKKINK